MRFTMSKDGVLRATVYVKHRISESDLEIIAFVADRENAPSYDTPPPKFRRATRAEVIAAIHRGFGARIDWQEEYVEEYWKLKDKEAAK